MADETPVPGTFSGANPGTPTLPSQSPQEMDNAGATDGLSIGQLQQQAPSLSIGQLQKQAPGMSIAQLQAQQSVGQKAQSFMDKIKSTMSPQAKEAAAVDLNLRPTPTSPVGKALNAVFDPISKYSTRAAMNWAVAGAAATGNPTAMELHQRLNPNNEMFPDSHYSDLTDFMMTKASGMAPQGTMGDMARSILNSPKTKAGIGMVADLITDPATYLGFGELTSEAKALQKVGNYTDIAASQAKNLISLKVPFTGIEKTLVSGEQGAAAAKAIKGSAPAKAVGSVLDAAAQTQLGSAAIQGTKDAAMIPAKIARALSPNTGIADIDYAMNTHAALTKGGDSQIITHDLQDVAAHKFSPEETRVVGELAESVPNLRPNLPESMIQAGEGKISATEAEIRAQAASKIEAVAQKLGHELQPGRDQAIIDGVILAKKSDSSFLESQHAAGKLTEENVASQVRENHIPHVMDPKFIGNEAAEMVRDKYNSPVSSRGLYKERKMEGTVYDLNQKIAKEHPELGDKFFIDDPFVATAVRKQQGLRSLRDTQLLDVVKRYGVQDGKEARKAGMLPIPHPELEGRELAFPPEIATKVSYYLGTKAVGNATGGIQELVQAMNKSVIGTQNRILRATVFTSPGIWVRNGLDNLIKAHIYGVGPDAWKNTSQIIWDSWKGETSAANSINKAGKFYSAKDMNEIFNKFGASTMSSFREGMGPLLDATKPGLLERMGSNPGLLGTKAVAEAAEAMMQTVGKYGEKAETFARKAFLYQKIIKEGYEPAAAADLMTRVMFDYTRNSPMTDAARFFSPFAQHPIKTALAAPMLIGKSPGTYNFIHNIFPRVLGNALSDPMTQTAMNQLMPDFLKNQDAIAGPVIGGDSWMVHVFGKPTGPAGMQTYITPGVGMSILNHLQNPGLNPTFQALLDFTRGKTQTGVPIPGTEKWNYLFRQSLTGTVALNNSEAILKDALGLSDPKYYEEATVKLMRAATSQFGGAIDLDKAAHMKLTTLSYLEKDLKQSTAQQLRTEMQGLGKPQSYSSYVNVKYGPLVPSTNAQIYQDTMLKMGTQQSDTAGQMNQTVAAQQYADKKLTAGEYAARLLNIQQNIKNVNQALQFSYGRYLDMSSGAKNPTDARAKAGVKLTGH